MREQSDVGLIYRLADEGIVGIQDEEGYFTEKNTMEEVQLKTLKNRSWADVKRAYVELEPNKKSGTAYYEVEIPKYEDGNKPRVTVITGDKNNYLPLLGDIIASKEVEDGTLQVYSTPLESDEEIKGVKVVVGLATGGDHASYIVIEQDEFHIKEPEPEPEPEPENKEIELEETGESEYYNTDINGDRKNLLKEEVEYGKRDGKLYGEEIELKQSYKYTESRVNKGDTIKFTLKPISEYHKLDRVEKTMLPEVELKGKQELDNGEVEYTYEVISEDMDVGEQKVDIQAYYKPKSYEDYHEFYEEGFKLKDGKVLNYHIVPRTFTIDDFEVVGHEEGYIEEGKFTLGKEREMVQINLDTYFGENKQVNVVLYDTGEFSKIDVDIFTDVIDRDVTPTSINHLATLGILENNKKINTGIYVNLENVNETTELYEEDNIEIGEDSIGVGIGNNKIETYKEKVSNEIRELVSKSITERLYVHLETVDKKEVVEGIRKSFKIVDNDVGRLDYKVNIELVNRIGNNIKLLFDIEQDISLLGTSWVNFEKLEDIPLNKQIYTGENYLIEYSMEVDTEVGSPTELKIGEQVIELDIPNVIKFK